MIIILATVEVAAEHLDEALRSSQEHVERSLAEPGCIDHGVYISPGNANRLVFIEKWADGPAMTVHFGVPEARAFAKALAAVAVQPPALEIFEAQPLG